jgi:hypothetical protein
LVKETKFEKVKNCQMKIEVSNGEIIDILTIIQIKLERKRDPEKLKNLQKEFEILRRQLIQS